LLRRTSPPARRTTRRKSNVAEAKLAQGSIRVGDVLPPNRWFDGEIGLRGVKTRSNMA
jgi:hypothetical protein